MGPAIYPGPSSADSYGVCGTDLVKRSPRHRPRLPGGHRNRIRFKFWRRRVWRSVFPLRNWLCLAIFPLCRLLFALTLCR